MGNTSSQVYVITGATGYIGHELTKLFVQRGDTVILIVRPTQNEDVKERVQSEYDFTPEAWKRVHVIQANICDLVHDSISEQIETILGGVGRVDAIVHLAANLSFRSKDGSEVIKTNVNGTRNIAGLAKELNTTLYFISTAYVHGKSQGVHYEQTPNQEKFNNSYEQSKYEAELALLALKEMGLKYVVIRPSVVFGTMDSKGEPTTLFGYYALVRAMLGLKQLLVKFCIDHPYISASVGIHMKDKDVCLNYLPFMVTPTTMNLIPLSIVCENVARLVSLREKLPNGTILHLVNPTPLTMHQISKVTLKEIGLRMHVVTMPRSVVTFLYKIIFLLSYIVPSLRDVSKKLHYYGFYMTTTYEFDQNIFYNYIDKEAYIRSFEQQKNELSKTAKVIEMRFE